MRINKKEVPVVLESPNATMRTKEGLGGMSICVNSLAKGTDVGPLLEGLKNDSCHCPHWGYIFKGSMRVKYDDGKEEVLKEGDVYYLPEGHTGVVEEDLEMLEINPTKQWREVLDHITRKMEAMQ
ncbi:MAG: cupin domain-containing protein [Salegentibacter sp.]